ncbi:MAG: DUF465 domain-containing protein [Nitrospirae bacterium GWC2_42_7]|nr:MAG: DUF465 domain-containing protein [Nitrospirae bacterium GWC2_42_7]
MNLKEEEIIEKLKKENEEFRKTCEEHHSLDSLITDMDKKVYLNPEEDIERKKLAKQKLLKKDKIAEMVREYKKVASS